MSDKRIQMIRADLSPCFTNDGHGVDHAEIEDWQGAVMFDAAADIAFDELEKAADQTVATWAEVHEWSVEIICTGLYRLTPREWTTKPVRFDVECHSCKRGDGGKCIC